MSCRGAVAGGSLLKRRAFQLEAMRIGLDLSDRQLDLFEEFEQALYQANIATNLTRIEASDCWIRHFLDSLMIHDLIPVGSTVLDIGSGPGFPSWPLACARPDLQVTALDSAGKMLGFLKTQPLHNLVVMQGRSEEVEFPTRFDVVTGRALAPLSIQLELSARHCRRGGLVIPMRTESDLGEIERLRKNPFQLELVSVEHRILPVANARRLFPVFLMKGNESQGPKRTWADILKRPF